METEIEQRMAGTGLQGRLTLSHICSPACVCVFAQFLRDTGIDQPRPWWMSALLGSAMDTLFCPESPANRMEATLKQYRAIRAAFCNCWCQITDSIDKPTMENATERAWERMVVHVSYTEADTTESLRDRIMHPIREYVTGVVEVQRLGCTAPQSGGLCIYPLIFSVRTSTTPPNEGDVFCHITLFGVHHETKTEWFYDPAEHWDPYNLSECMNGWTVFRDYHRWPSLSRLPSRQNRDARSAHPFVTGREPDARGYGITEAICRVRSSRGTRGVG